MYSNAQTARIPGRRTTSHGWVSTYPPSQNAGRVSTVQVLDLGVVMSWTLRADAEVCDPSTRKVTGIETGDLVTSFR